MPQLNAFTRMIRAAIHGSNDFTLPFKQVQKPLQWFAALAEMSVGPLERNCSRRAPMGHDLKAIHLWTQRNETCDALSRLSASNELPTVLSTAKEMRRLVLENKVLGGRENR